MALGIFKMERMLRDLRDLRQSATFESAGFDPMHDRETVIPAGGVTDFIREKTDLYRRTWIIARADELIDTIEKEIAASRSKR